MPMQKVHPAPAKNLGSATHHWRGQASIPQVTNPPGPDRACAAADIETHHVGELL